MSEIATYDIEKFSRPNWIEVDAAGIRANIGALRARVGPGVALFAALKGNACGFDLVKAGLLIEKCGAEGVAVVDMGDALALRRAGVRCPILLFGGMWLNRDVVEAAVKHDLMLTAHDFRSLETIVTSGRGALPTFLEFNVGGERLGFEPEAVGQVIDAVGKNGGLRLVGVSAHMHVPGGDRARAVIEWQFSRFRGVLMRLSEAGLTPRYSMIASSKTLVLTNDMNLSAADPGHLVFGLMPRAEAEYGSDLRMALLAVKSRLIQVNMLNRKEHLADAPFPAVAGVRSGVIPFGATDGLDRIHCGYVLVNGSRAPLVGSPMTEHSRIDLTRVPSAKPGDEVVIFGKQQESEITLEDVQSVQKSMRSSDLTRSISARIPRIYVDS